MSSPTAPLSTTSTPPGHGSATVAAAFRATVRDRPDEPALRAFGHEGALTWSAYDRRVRRVAAGLARLGIGHGDTVGMLLLNRPAFHVVDTASIHLGAVPFSLYLTSSPEQLEYLVRHSGCRVLVVEPTLLERVRGLDAPTLETIVVADVDGEGPADAAGADLTLDGLEALGDANAGFDLDAAVAAVRPDDVATLIYTSGTTGPPKGVEMTHANLMTVLESCQDRAPFREHGATVSYLPHAHMADRLIAHYLAIYTGWELTTVADPRQVMAAVAEVRPTWFMGVPRIWEKLRAGLLASFQALEPAQRDAVEGALERSLAVVRRADEETGIVPADVLGELSEQDAAALRGIAGRLGFDRLDLLLSGAAPLARGVHEFFLALGLPLGEGWGMSETGSLGTVQPPGATRIETIGHVMPRGELRIADDGEILVRGPHVTPGYRDDPERTAEAIDADGWLHTGDVARRAGAMRDDAKTNGPAAQQRLDAVVRRARRDPASTLQGWPGWLRRDGDLPVRGGDWEHFLQVHRLPTDHELADAQTRRWLRDATALWFGTPLAAVELTDPAGRYVDVPLHAPSLRRRGDRTRSPWRSTTPRRRSRPESGND
ncbi:MAG: AMP-binding protein [Solirubrobacteraceae bacterium]|nr:AMP-binding protein [Solirubrobacteraceae bacterium]